VLLVVIVAIVGSSLLSAFLFADWVQQRQEENLGRVVKTLTDASFPLNESVLKKMSGLSGAEFALLDAAGNLQAASRDFSEDDLAALRQLPRTQTLANFAAGQTLELGGTRHIAARLSVPDRTSADAAPLSLAVLYPEERWSAARRQATYLPLSVGAGSVLAAIVVATLVAHRVVRPLESLRRQAAAIEQGDFRPMPAGKRNDEIQDLTRSINHMVERLARYEADVRQNERLRTLGQLGAGIAHQMRNAATGARLALDLHRRECQSEADGEALMVAARQLTLMETYLQRFLTLGRQQPLERRPVDFAALVEEVLPLVRPACDHAGITLEFRRPVGPLQISGEPQALTQMLVNLLLNAIEAASAEGIESGTRKSATGISVAATSGLVRVEVSRDAAGQIICRVSDTGRGPSPEIAQRLFEPFVTDKPDGTGLGLAVVRQIAQEHQAELSWRRDGSLTQFTVSFPTQTRSASEGG